MKIKVKIYNFYNDQDSVYIVYNLNKNQQKSEHFLDSLFFLVTSKRVENKWKIVSVLEIYDRLVLIKLLFKTNKFSNVFVCRAVICKMQTKTKYCQVQDLAPPTWI